MTRWGTTTEPPWRAGERADSLNVEVFSWAAVNADVSRIVDVDMVVRTRSETVEQDETISVHRPIKRERERKVESHARV